MVTRNVNHGDATTRGLLGLVLLIVGMDLLILGLPFAAGTTWLFGLALEATAFSGFCPLYKALGVGTC